MIMAAVAEMLDAFMTIASQATPEQKELYMRLLQLRLRGSRLGTIISSVMANSTSMDDITETQK
jgi:hypothetical protein